MPYKSLEKQREARKKWFKKWALEHPDERRELRRKSGKKRRNELVDYFMKNQLRALGYDLTPENLRDIKEVYKIYQIRREVCKKDPNLKGYWKRGRLKRLEK